MVNSTPVREHGTATQRALRAGQEKPADLGKKSGEMVAGKKHIRPDDAGRVVTGSGPTLRLRKICSNCCRKGGGGAAYFFFNCGFAKFDALTGIRLIS